MGTFLEEAQVEIYSLTPALLTKTSQAILPGPTFYLGTTELVFLTKAFSVCY